VGALLSEERDKLADLRVVDRVLQRVGRVASVSPTSNRRSSTRRWPTSRSASLTPWWVYSDNPVISDRDRLGAALGIVVAVLVQLILAVVIATTAAGAVVEEILGQLFPVGSVVVAGIVVPSLTVHRQLPNVAAATASASRTGPRRAL